MPGRRDATADILQNLNPSIPTRTISADDPITQPPPTPPDKRKPPKPKGIDPYELVKHEFKIDLFELLHYHVPNELQGEITRKDKASFYLVFDKTFRGLVKGDFQHWGFPPIDGEVQAMYLWYYCESYGRGYRTCPMGQSLLEELLGWSKNKVKRVMKRLLNYGRNVLEHGIVTKLEQFPPYDYSRAQIYRVYLPREMLAIRWRALSEQARRRDGIEGIQELRALFGKNEEIQEILPILEETSASDDQQASATP
jgi:hypothetical protein